MKKNELLVILLVALVGSTTPLTGKEPKRIWTTSTFLDFCEGTLVDGGVNTYVAADGTVRLINLWCDEAYSRWGLPK